MIFVIDFGSQTAHLIGRRIEAFGVPTKIVLPKQALHTIKKEKPDGIILSGGPSSVYEKGVPTVDVELFELGIPILSICYGFQLFAKLLGGKVVSGKKEYGPAKLETGNWKLEIVKDLPKSFVVWMSHGDEITKIPAGFEVLGTTSNMPFAIVEDKKRKIIGLQFHPEVEHTQFGNQILQNFVAYCGLAISQKSHGLNTLIADIKKRVGEYYIIGAVSGGVDSTVAATLTAKAVGKQLIPVYVDNGLMRPGTGEWVKKIFSTLGVQPLIVTAEKEMLKRLKGIADPEKKRKVIGAFYIELFEREMSKLLAKGHTVRFLLQGTIYSDVIESKGSTHASKIKSHHNVGGLPKNMKLLLVEPLRTFYKDEVRQLGLELGLPKEFVYKQPFPGPGFAVRIRGEVTQLRLEKMRQADTIVLEELEKANLLKDVFQSYPVLTGANSTAVKGDDKFFGEVIALRIVESTDIMTATWARLPYDVLQTISSRIVNEVPAISRVVYDITTKPPATMEWE